MAPVELKNNLTVTKRNILAVYIYYFISFLYSYSTFSITSGITVLGHFKMLWSVLISTGHFPILSELIRVELYHYFYFANNDLLNIDDTDHVKQITP